MHPTLAGGHVAVLLSLVAAVSWGASDFLGGLAGRRSEDDRTAAITFWTQGTGMVLLVGLSAVVGGTLLRSDVVLGLVGGVVGAVAVAALYRGLSVGTISVVAPVTGALAAAVPVLVGVLRGERPSGLAWAGIVLALGSIVLVAREESVGEADERPVNREALVLAVAAGLGFAGIFVVLDLVSVESGLWPLVLFKFGGVATAGTWMFVAGAPRAPAVGTWPLVLSVGVLDNAANVTYLLATREGLLALVAVLASLYPAFTVVLARVVLQERLQRVQLAGMVLAGCGVSLIAVG